MKESDYQFTLENIYGFFGKSENLILGSLFLFIVFLIAQHSMVFLYHDDWGISVLHYVGKQTGVKGQEFDFSHVIDFLWDMYNRWTGRVVSIFSHIYLEKAGIWYVRLWQVLAIFSTVFLAYKIAVKALGINDKSYLFIFSIVLYLALPDRALITGVYWFSASSGYLWGVPFFLLGVYLNTRTDKLKFPPYALMAFAATFHELMGIAIIAYLCSSAFFYIKEFTYKRVAYYFVPVLTAAATILSPGNFARKKVSDYGDYDTFEHVITNFNVLVDRLFSPELFDVHNLFFVIIFFSFLAMFWRIIPKTISVRYKVSGMVLAFLFFTISSVTSGIIFIIAYTFLIFLSCKELVGKKIIIPLYVSSFAALLPLLMAPGIAWRAEVTFLLLMFVPLLFSIGLLETKNEIKFRNIFGLVVIIFACSNTYSVYAGFKKNYSTNQANDFILRAVSNRIDRNIDVGEKVLLFKLPAPYYAETMPYDRPLIEIWMKQYYSLPVSIVFEWK